MRWAAPISTRKFCPSFGLRFAPDGADFFAAFLGTLTLFRLGS
jgi:hypothetical protein